MTHNKEYGDESKQPGNTIDKTDVGKNIDGLEPEEEDLLGSGSWHRQQPGLEAWKLRCCADYRSHRRCSSRYVTHTQTHTAGEPQSTHTYTYIIFIHYLAWF